MNSFSWYEADSLLDALEKVNATVSQAIQPNRPDQAFVIKAGGIDLLDLMKEGIVQPDKLVYIRNIPGLDKVEFNPYEGMRIGANVTLSEMEFHPDLAEHFPALQMAVAHAGTPNLRNTATLGGNLAQRTRCWYFRSAEHLCFRKGSGTCFARTGENAIHAIMKNGACASVHSSSVATALMAYDAQVAITNAGGVARKVPIQNFFVLPGDDPTRENILEADELITGVVLGIPQKEARAHYIKQGARESHDWAIADVAVHLTMNKDTCTRARIALGAAAPVPVLAVEAAAELEGKVITEEIAVRAAEVSMKQATPLSKNAYKVPIFKAIIKRAILKAIS